MTDAASEPVVLVTRPRRGIVVATLNRPHRMNALTEEVFHVLGDLCAELRLDSAARVLLLRGAGENFCSGYDIDEVGRVASLEPLDLMALLDRQARVVSALRDLPQAVVAAVDGVAAGAGLSLALAADVRVLTSRARLQAAFVRMGLSGGDMGASWLLPRIAGFGFASDMLLSGRFVDAEEALRHGVANRVTALQDLMAAAMDTAGQIAGNSPVSLRLTKHILQANADAPSLEVALAREAPVQVAAAKSADVREAVAAFQERRAPRFGVGPNITEDMSAHKEEQE
ncbi:enoyl-CoA hydratase/isomerase family protein [Streptomyces sp. NPDC017993]|uniref:enoyl-CoA hydratase/isomerase family protein n=1 Tax=Streptomyces sp. NPDC017993 TaxID=3365027 RepID=UPI0037B7F2F4